MRCSRIFLMDSKIYRYRLKLSHDQVNVNTPVSTEHGCFKTPQELFVASLAREDGRGADSESSDVFDWTLTIWGPFKLPKKMTTKKLYTRSLTEPFEKIMVGRRAFPFMSQPIFRGQTVKLPQGVRVKFMNLGPRWWQLKHFSWFSPRICGEMITIWQTRMSCVIQGLVGLVAKKQIPLSERLGEWIIPRSCNYPLMRAGEVGWDVRSFLLWSCTFDGKKSGIHQLIWRIYHYLEGFYVFQVCVWSFWTIKTISK